MLENFLVRYKQCWTSDTIRILLSVYFLAHMFSLIFLFGDLGKDNPQENVILVESSRTISLRILDCQDNRMGEGDGQTFPL